MCSVYLHLDVYIEVCFCSDVTRAVFAGKCADIKCPLMILFALYVTSQVNLTTGLHLYFLPVLRFTVAFLIFSIFVQGQHVPPYVFNCFSKNLVALLIFYYYYICFSLVGVLKHTLL